MAEDRVTKIQFATKLIFFSFLLVPALLNAEDQVDPAKVGRIGVDPQVFDPENGNWMDLQLPQFGLVPVKPLRAVKFSTDIAEQITGEIKKNSHLRDAEKSREITYLQQRIERPSTAVVRLRDLDILAPHLAGGDLFWGLPHFARWKISRLAGNDLLAYRKLVDDRAESLFNKRDREGLPDADALRTLTRLYYASSRGDDALELLGDLAFSEGRPNEADHWYRQLIVDKNSPGLALTYPDPEPRRQAMVYAKYLLNRVALGDFELRQKGVELFLKKFPEDPVPPASGLFGRKNLVDPTDRPLGLSHYLGLALANDKIEALFTHTPQWSSFGGGPSGQATVFAAPAQRSRFLTAPLPADGVPDANHHPLLFADRAWLAEDGRVFTVDYKSEKPGWTPWYDTGDRSGRSTPLSAAEGRVFAQIPDDTIVAFSTRARRAPLWRITVAQLHAHPVLADKPGDLFFEGPPVAEYSQVYVGLVLKHVPEAELVDPREPHPLVDTSQFRHHYLASLDAATGEVRWLVPVSTFEWTEMGIVRSWSRPPRVVGPSPYDPNYGRQLVSVQNGSVYYQTNDGFFAALDAHTGEIAWLARYPGHEKKPRDPSPPFLSPVLDATRVAALPLDLERVFVLDAETGARLFEETVTHADIVIGMRKEKLTVTGEALTVFNLNNRSRSWSWRSEAKEPFQGFRGILTDSQFIWPRREGFLTFALDDGKLQTSPALVAPGRESNLVSAEDFFVGAVGGELVIFPPQR